ncbi:MAG: EAL domain-containing protein [Deltaproteobacteria bacterium]|nr:EAL domain-containing protein [Deltaproteobacteria bacterium]
MLRTACAQLAAWRASGAVDVTFRASINLSPMQLTREGFAERVAAILDAHGVPPNAIELEITERSLMRSEHTVETNLNALRGLGLRLSLDDFGTGFSSLSYLRRFRFDVLKIDRSFVRDLIHDPEDGAITNAILSMSRALGLRVIAEGVETEAQRAYLCERGCELMQGYLFSRPIEASALAGLFGRALGPEGACAWTVTAPSAPPRHGAFLVESPLAA